MRRLTAMAVTALVGILAIATIAQVSLASTPAQQAAPGTHQLTFIGTDFRPLDGGDIVRFAQSTGGGMWIKTNAVTDTYLEAGVELPDGAQVTEVTFYVRNCETTYSPDLYFGAYTPSSGVFTYTVPAFAPLPGACGQTQSIVKPIDPAVTVDNSQQRFVIGYLVRAFYFTDSYDSSQVRSLLVGARVTYQAPGAFLPMIRR